MKKAIYLLFAIWVMFSAIFCYALAVYSMWNIGGYFPEPFNSISCGGTQAGIFILLGSVCFFVVYLMVAFQHPFSFRSKSVDRNYYAHIQVDMNGFKIDDLAFLIHTIADPTGRKLSYDTVIGFWDYLYKGNALMIIAPFSVWIKNNVLNVSNQGNISSITEAMVYELKYELETRLGDYEESQIDGFITSQLT